MADYQFGEWVGRSLFPDGVEIRCSRGTGRVRHVYLNGELLATLRPRDGLFSLTIDGVERLIRLIKPPRLRVVVQDVAEEFVSDGKDVFSRHVMSADEEIRPGEEVIVVDVDDRVLAVGKALLTGREMSAFKRGVAVKVRKGRGQD